MGPVQVIPPGLLGFFQLKTFGRNPAELSETLQPSLECFEWYMQAQLRDVVQDLGVPQRAIATTGPWIFSPNQVTVPNGEIWWVEHFTVRTVALVAGESIRVAPLMQRPLFGTVNQFLLGGSSTAIAGEMAIARADRPFWAAPGSDLGFFVSAIATAGAISVQGYLRYVRIPL